MLALTSIVFPHGVMARATASDASIRHQPPPRVRGPQDRYRSILQDRRSPAATNDAMSDSADQSHAPSELVAVFVPDLFLLPVAQQPPDLPQFVSPLDDTLTEFSAASGWGSIGLIAHNYLAGAEFFRLRAADEFFLVYADGRREPFVISSIERYQALQPDSPYSEFIDLESGEQLMASELHDMIYETPGRVVFQTCIAHEDEDEWGRLFVIAEPAPD